MKTDNLRGLKQDEESVCVWSLRRRQGYSTAAGSRSARAAELVGARPRSVPRAWAAPKPEKHKAVLIRFWIFQHRETVYRRSQFHWEIQPEGRTNGDGLTGLVR